MPDTVANNAVALILDGDDIDAETLRSKLSAALKGAGLPVWSAAEAEVFARNGHILILARPQRPLRERTLYGNLRLNRKR